MKSKYELSIAIPTFNRDDYLNECLVRIANAINGRNVEVVVCDNGSTDFTSQIVKENRSKIKHLKYINNIVNLGPDKNFEIALTSSSAEYVWLLGDATYFDENCLNAVLNKIKEINPVLLVVNSNRVSDVLSKTFDDPESLFRSLGWHMTQMSSLIFNIKIIQNCNFKRFYDTDFIQTGIVFEYLSEHMNAKVAWIADVSIHPISLPGKIKNSWQGRAFDIWLSRWINFIFSLPPIYSLESKLLTIKMHNDRSKIFGLKYLLHSKRHGNYNYQVYKKYKNNISLGVSSRNKIKFIFAALFPAFILNYFAESKIRRVLDRNSLK